MKGRGYSWDDVQVFLALLDSGTTLAAGDALGLDPTTVARRITGLEHALGVTLFDRRPDGYRATELARRLEPAARATRSSAEAFAEIAGAHRRALTGTVRITTTELVGSLVMAPLIAALAQTHPGLTIELVADDRPVDLGRGAADIAVRIGPRPDQDGLVLRRLPDTVWAVYSGAGRAARYGVPRSPGDLAVHPLVLAEGRLEGNPALRWLESLVPDPMIAARFNSISGLIAAVRSDAGLSALPCFVAGGEPGFVRCLGDGDCVASPVWLVHHQSKRGRPELRVVLDATIKRFEELRARFSGKA
jgi:DNA-binding transcriptional LysR family regulator